jgi:hypothetical protein
MPQYFGAPNGSSRSRRRIVARGHPGDVGRPAEFGGLGDVGRSESAYQVLLSEGTLPVPAERVGRLILVNSTAASASRRVWWCIRGCHRMISAGIWAASTVMRPLA